MNRFLALVFFALIAAPVVCFAKPSASQSTDCRAPQFKDKASVDLFIRKNPKSPQLAQATFCLGEIARKQYLKSKDKVALKAALSSYEKVARKYSNSGLAPDALLALGDLRRSGLKDEVAARAAYFEVIDRYPRSAAVAKKRLNPAASQSGTDLQAKAPEKQILKPTPTEVARDILVETRHQMPEPTPTSSPIRATPTDIPVRPSTSTQIGQVAKTSSLPTAQATAEVDLVDAPAPGSGKEILLDESVVPKRPLIVIDPGHGGEDQGAKGVDGILEKNIVLEVSKELEQLLRNRLRAKTFLTRTTDVFIPLAERTKLANDRNADLFVSIHANASEYKTAQGIETYYLDNTNEKSSLKLADRENASLNFGPKQNSDLGFIFSDLIQNVKLDDSISLAHHLQNSLTQTLSRYYQGINNLGVKKAPFYVLVGAHMPCVLSEISFIDHPLEGKRLGEERYQKLLAQAIYEGIRKFFIKREVK